MGSGVLCYVMDVTFVVSNRSTLCIRKCNDSNANVMGFSLPITCYIVMKKSVNIQLMSRHAGPKEPSLVCRSRQA